MDMILATESDAESNLVNQWVYFNICDVEEPRGAELAQELGQTQLKGKFRGYYYPETGGNPLAVLDVKGSSRPVFVRKMTPIRNIGST